MIKVKANSSKISVLGHADYETKGKDIVCASVSSIITTTVNAILRFDDSTITYESKEGAVTIEILKEDKTTGMLIENMLEMLEELSHQYPKNIKVERE